MNGAVVVDTHTAIWYLLESRQLSTNALTAMDAAAENGEPVYLPSISLVEAIFFVVGKGSPAGHPLVAG